MKISIDIYNDDTDNYVGRLTIDLDSIDSSITAIKLLSSIDNAEFSLEPATGSWIDIMFDTDNHKHISDFIIILMSMSKKERKQIKNTVEFFINNTNFTTIKEAFEYWGFEILYKQIEPFVNKE